MNGFLFSKFGFGSGYGSKNFHNEGPGTGPGSTNFRKIGYLGPGPGPVRSGSTSLEIPFEKNDFHVVLSMSVLHIFINILLTCNNDHIY